MVHVLGMGECPVLLKSWVAFEVLGSMVFSLIFSSKTDIATLMSWSSFCCGRVLNVLDVKKVNSEKLAIMFGVV